MIIKKEDFFGICDKLSLVLTKEIIDGMYENFKIEIEGEDIR